MIILLGDFNAKLIVNSITSKTLAVKNTIFPHLNIRKQTQTSPDGTTHNQADHIPIDKRWHLSILKMQSFRGADCDTDHSLVAAKVRESLAVRK
jgi:hypothetical protein